MELEHNELLSKVNYLTAEVCFHDPDAQVYASDAKIVLSFRSR